MKTFTKLFTLLFAFTIMGMNLNAQAPAPPWTSPNGDASAPLMEVWVLSATTPSGDLVNGDQIAAFDGDKLVGLLTISGITSPSTTVDLTNWSSNRLMLYSKDMNGNDLYQPGNSIILKAYKATVVGNVDGYAYTWDAESEGFPHVDGHFNFHNTWFAPTGDSTGFVNQGPFYPKEGASSYCYVELDFTGVAVSYDVELTFNVINIAGDGINDVTISSGEGYIGETAGGTLATGGGAPGTIMIPVFKPSISNIDYVFKIEHVDYDTEWLTVSVVPDGGVVPDIEITLDLYGSVAGVIIYDGPDGQQVAEGAVATVSFGDSLYADMADEFGNYSIIGIPDGTWPLTITYPEYQTDEIDLVISSATLNPVYNFILDQKTGTVQGEVFNAQTLQLMINTAVSIKLDGDEVINTTDEDGAYSFSYTAGTYDLEVILAGYHSILIDDYVIAPEVTTTENFNLLDENEGRKFEEVTGNPNTLWSIQIESARFGSSSLLPFDELAIYKDNGNTLYTDDELVGSIRLNKSTVYQNSGYNVLKAYGQNNSGATLFSGGESFYFKAYDVSHGNGDTTELPISWNFNQYMGTYHGNVFPDPADNDVSYLNIYWEFPSGSIIGNVVSGGDNIVDIEVINIFTHEVVATGETDGNGDFILGLDPGTYNVKFSKDTYATQTISDIVVVLGEVNDMGPITLGARDNREVTYALGTGMEPGFYFIGRCLEDLEYPEPAPLVGSEMLTILDRYVGSFAPFSLPVDNPTWEGWVEDENGNDLKNDGGAPYYWDPVDYKWALNEGYQVYREVYYSFKMKGYVVEPEDNPIEINFPAWNYVPYYPYDYDNPDDAITAFASILESIDWVMDEYGNRLHNDNGNWIDNIGQMDPRQGYKIKAHHSATLVYPASASKGYKSNRIMLDPIHYVYNDGNAADWTYTMYINTNDFDIGDEIAAYSNGVMVGSMVIDSDLAWENDLNTFFAAVESGYEISSDIELMAWDASEGNDYYIEFEMVPEVADAYIGTKYPAGLDHFSYVNVYRGTVRVDENQINNDIRVYPNPTSNMINIESVSNINTIKIYNIHGALIDIVTVNSTTQSVNVENFASGTYLIQMNTDTGVITKRILVK